MPADAHVRLASTHVGSLVRPDESCRYLRAIDAGERYDEAAYEQCLRDSVKDVVRRQKEAGIDVVSDGEYGKSSWNYYVYRRLGGGLEVRPAPTVRMADAGEGSRAEDPTVPTDWARFPEFYADYFANEQGDYEEPGGIWACTARSPTPARTSSPATSPTSRRPCGRPACRRASCRSWRRPAASRP